jgi:hypothetical protein
MSAPRTPMLANVMITRGRVETECLDRALLNLAARGLRTHCSDPATHGLWLSESVAKRRETTKLCQGCPVLRECGAAAQARVKVSGFGAASTVCVGKCQGRPTGDVIASPEQSRYLAAAVLVLCPAAPRRFASPPELARARDKLHAATRNDRGPTGFADLAPVADLSPCIGRKLPAESVG